MSRLLRGMVGMDRVVTCAEPGFVWWSVRYDPDEAKPKLITVKTEGEDLNGDPAAEYIGREAADEVRRLLDDYDTMRNAWVRHGSESDKEPTLTAMPPVPADTTPARAVWEHVKDHYQEDEE